jgi:GNAT superfamily N-acetyltransferase
MAMRDAPAVSLRLREEIRAADAERVAGLVAATGLFSEAEVAIARELVLERLAKGAASGYEFVLAEQRGALAGYACYGPVPATASSFTLYWIAVAPPLQSRGVGRLLLARVAARASAAGGERLYAETSSRPEYGATLGFYAACGFHRVARLPDHFGPGDAKLILERPLAGDAAH